MVNAKWRTLLERSKSIAVPFRALRPILTRYCSGWSGFALSAALQEPDLEQPKRNTFFLRE
jgi:hypothetical protein